ncbi:MAG: hypothetical protein GWN18_06675, partial [Thermoplasmata archaeon]|nr:hypothetical protein [Thermoplasmata archaeon]NIS11761.1 hypothetical protein [Thermoplasmata archaeon]NIS19652.1 hypothetical protein [Thermoplasmata archaeon]NIT76829.1 hypothetical protein [Thermoplasmata archaeon]NIU48764.1 hypothetical protein [Thermoplasmata archaeon]
YRVYYGNPSALDPGYPPLLLGAELWNYRSILDANFINAWSSLRWSGGNGAGWGVTRFDALGDDVKMMTQRVNVNQGRTYSQVWTSKALKNDDFQLTTWVGGFNHTGPQRSTAMWALDFRVSGDDCYRLMYTESFTNGSQPKLSLLRVSVDRHLESMNTTANWRTLDELAVEPIGSDIVPIRIRCRGTDIDVWVGWGNSPALRARDNIISTGEIGTFVGGRGVLFSGWDTTVSCSIGPILILPPNVNLTDKSHSFFPHEERKQFVTSGSWVSDPYHLPGARDAILTLDVELPFETKYSANLLDAEDGAILFADLRDGDQVPEKVLEGPFKLQVVLESTHDWITPELRAWGLGYRASVNTLSDRGSPDKENVAVLGDAFSLMPSRDVWLKENLPVLSPGNIPEDGAGVTIGSVVPYGNGWRVYYTGESTSGTLSICVAISTDGETFTEFIPIFGDSNVTMMEWDSIKRSPK